jgi:hypothetical protein
MEILPGGLIWPDNFEKVKAGHTALASLGFNLYSHLILTTFDQEAVSSLESKKRSFCVKRTVFGLILICTSGLSHAWPKIDRFFERTLKR